MTNFWFENNPIGDGMCHGGLFYSAECGWEEGDCDDFFAQYQEMKLQRFGRSSLVLMNTISVRKPKGLDESREDFPHPTPTRIGTLTMGKSNNSMSKLSRDIMNRALSYCLAFFFSSLKLVSS